MIEIRQPELEALILERQRAGCFENIEQTLMDALKEAPPPKRANAARPGPTGAEIIAAFQRSPHKEVNIFPESYVLPISDPVKF